MLVELIGMTPQELAYTGFCVFIAAVARGFSGFGFTLLTIMSLSFILPPAVIVPAMFVLEIVAGIKLLPEIWGKVHWRSIKTLVVASIVATPFGAYLLVSLSAFQVKLMLAIIVTCTGGALLSGFKMRRMPSFFETAATGAGAGILNGALGLGGPPVIVFFLGSSLALAAGRASIIAAFLAMDFAALPTLWMLGLFTRESMLLGLVALLPLMLGVFCGSKLAHRADERVARKLIVIVLLMMAVGMFLDLFKP